MSNNKNPFFKVENLQHLELKVSGINSTSQVPFKENSLHLIQILENGICIEVPPKSCAMGHSLSLNISGLSMEEPIPVIGVIENIEGDSNNIVQLKFRQYSQENWKKLLEYFSGKQTSINTFIKNSRK